MPCADWIDRSQFVLDRVRAPALSLLLLCYCMGAPGSPRRGAASSAVPSGNVIETPGPQTSTSSSSRRLALVLATVAGAGLAPVAPGTAGSAVAVLLFLPLSALGLPLYALTVLALVFLGIWASDEAERAFERPDDGRIVIDEVAGQLITLTPLLWLDRLHLAVWLVTGFVLFRLFDIWKPGPVGRLERGLSGGLGVMLDDVAAGVLAALGLWVLVGVAGG